MDTNGQIEPVKTVSVTLVRFGSLHLQEQYRGMLPTHIEKQLVLTAATLDELKTMMQFASNDGWHIPVSPKRKRH